MVHSFEIRNRLKQEPQQITMLKSWGFLGGLTAAMAAGVYVLWGPISDKRKIRKGFVPGLLNLGNTCFLNALLQGLASCPSFIRWLHQFTVADPSKPRQGRELSMTLLQLLKALSRQSQIEDGVLDAGTLLDVLRLQKWHISSLEEQDSHELFHVLTTSLEEERDLLSSVNHLFDMQSLEKPSVESQEKNSSCRGRSSLLPIPSIWKNQNPFHGRLMSLMACKNCKQQSPVRFDSFDSLSLTIPSTMLGKTVTLDQCLQLFISSETIKEVECMNCTKVGSLRNNIQMSTAESVNKNDCISQRTTFVKQLALGKLPQCLCIHLQRLSWSNEGSPIKRHEHVQFTEFLHMGSYKYNIAATSLHQNLSQPDTSQCSDLQCCIKPLSFGSLSTCQQPQLPPTYPLNLVHDDRSSEYLFILTSVLVHHGDVHSGHFITYRRSPSSSRCQSPPFSSQWLWVSDDSVRKASLQEVLSSSAYLLFYERVCKPTLHTEKKVAT